MIPGNVDPRRPDKVQRYKAPQANGNAPAEDLTPDYMNILGPEPATANAESTADAVKNAEVTPPKVEDGHPAADVDLPPNTTNVIPTSPQYGVAIIPTTTAIDVPSESSTPSADALVESNTNKSADGDNKDMHSTPSRNDRFKVVKIASLEPFRRGRWKCMDYVDEAPPPTTTQSKTPQSQGSGQITGSIFMQTQSLPQPHLQQMIMQGGYTAPPQFYQNISNQGIPQTQYFFAAQPAGIQPQGLPQQIIGSSGVPQGAIQPQFINTSQAYFPAGVVPNSAVFTIPNFQNVQYVPSTLIPNQGSAFVPATSQTFTPQLPPNFQQSQTYAGPPTVAQSTVTTQPIVNGHAFPPQTEQQQQQQQQQPVASSLPSQSTKTILNSSQSSNQNVVQNQLGGVGTGASLPIQTNQQPVTVQNVVQTQQFQQYQQQQQQQQQQTVQSLTNPVNPQQLSSQPNPQIQQQQSVSQVQSSSAPQSLSQHNVGQVHTIPQVAPTLISMPQSLPVQVPPFDPTLPTNVYTNPQFVASVNSVQNVEGDGQSGENHAEGGSDQTSDNPTGEDPTRGANPVVNAIDNKIEQAMDLVKSHLMYTVREEVEVLKEKIAELMVRIQQLETENNFLRGQLPKIQNGHTNGTPDPPQ